MCLESREPGEQAQLRLRRQVEAKPVQASVSEGCNFIPWATGSHSRFLSSPGAKPNLHHSKVTGCSMENGLNEYEETNQEAIAVSEVRGDGGRNQVVAAKRKEFCRRYNPQSILHTTERWIRSHQFSACNSQRPARMKPRSFPTGPSPEAAPHSLGSSPELSLCSNLTMFRRPFLCLKHSSGNFHMQGFSLLFEPQLKCPILSTVSLEHPVGVGTCTVVYLSPFPGLRVICPSLFYIYFLLFISTWDMSDPGKQKAYIVYLAQCLPGMH